MGKLALLTGISALIAVAHPAAVQARGGPGGGHGGGGGGQPAGHGGGGGGGHGGGGGPHGHGGGGPHGHGGGGPHGFSGGGGHGFTHGGGGGHAFASHGGGGGGHSFGGHGGGHGLAHGRGGGHRGFGGRGGGHGFARASGGGHGFAAHGGGHGGPHGFGGNGGGHGITQAGGGGGWQGDHGFAGGREGNWGGFVRGCPPGLASKGCIPPGQARKLFGYGDPYANWYGSPYWNWDDPGHYWSYWDGYAYRIDRDSDVVVAFIPLLGGALFIGNVWPGYYRDYDVTPYYSGYYGYGPSYVYRYADDTVFAVERHSQRIEAVVGLLGNDDWAIGSPMPSGYDFYNIPPDYRDRYADSDGASYRYADGYVYEIDPRSLIVRRSFELAG